jgi:hypothetical protein
MVRRFLTIYDEPFNIAVRAVEEMGYPDAEDEELRLEQERRRATPTLSPW